MGYLIDIQTRLAGGGSAISELDQLAVKLIAAGEASTAAAEALKLGQQSYNQLEKAALNAQKAVEKAALKGAVPPELQANATKAADALRVEATALDKLKASATAAANEQRKLSEAFKKAHALEEASKAAARGSGNVKKLAGAFNDLGGPLGGSAGKALNLVDAFQDFSEVLGTGAGGPIAIVAALTVAVLALGVAVVGVTVKIASWAVGLADAAREVSIANDVLKIQHGALKDLDALLPTVQKKTGLAATEIQDLARQLAKANVSAGDMPAALEAIATAAALDKSMVPDLIKDLKSGKKSAGELAREMDRKFGGALAKKMGGLNGLTTTFKKNLADTFGGLNIEPLLAGLKTLVDLFDQNTAAGKTIKFIFESIFQPLIDGAAKAAPVVEAFFLGILIGALKLYIALKPAIKALGELFGKPDVGLTDALAVALFLGKSVVAAFAAIVAVIALIGAAFAAPLIAVAALGAAVGVFAIRVRDGIQGAVNFLKSVNLVELGASIIRGLAQGISSGASTVVSAMKGVVDGAIKSAKSLLGIASPSKVFAGIGENTAEGFTSGVEDGAGGARAAMSDMVMPSDAPTPAAPSAGGNSTGDISIVIQAPSGSAEDIAGAVRIVLSDLLKGARIQVGRAQEATT